MIKALYVDDEEGLLEIAKHYLESDGDIDLSITTSPETALQTILLGRFDVIISDYQMPRMSGLDLLKALRSKGITTPFIIFTGRGREEVVMEALNNGADFYLQKGGELNAQFTELRHKIKMAVERSKQRGEIQQFSDIVVRMQTGLFILRFDGGQGLSDLKLQSMNPSATRLMSMGEDMIGKSVQEILPRITEDQWNGGLTDSILSGRPFHIPNLEYPDIDGNPRFYDINASPIGGEGIALLVHEITATEMAIREVRENEHKYRSVFDNRMLAISVIEAETLKIIDVNDRWCEQYGYDRTEAAGLSQIDVTAEPEVSREALKGVISTGQGHADLRMHRRKGGETFSVELNASTFNWRGKIFITITSHDISNRRLAEEKLKQSEERNEELLKSANSTIIQWTPDGRLTYVNEFASKFFGFEKDELVGKNLIGTIVAANDLNGNDNVKLIKEIGSHPDRFIYNENENQKNDGNRVWTRWSNSPILADDGTVKEIVSVGTDITERKMMEIKLIASQKELSDIIEFLPDATFVIDINGIVVAWNRAMEEMSGVRKGDMVGKGDTEYSVPFYGVRRKQLLDLVNQDDPEIERKYEFVKRNGMTVYAEVFCPALKGGRGAHVWATAAPLFNAGGERIGAIESIRDVTDRKLILEAVRDSEERLRMINDSSDDLIYSYDRYERFTSANSTMCAAMKLQESQIIGRTHAELGFPEEQCREWDDLHRRVYETGRTVRKETSTPMPDGSVHHYEVVLNPLHDLSQNIVGIGGITREITSKNRQEKMIRAQLIMEKVMSSSSELNDVLKACLGAAMTISDMDCGGIYLVQEDGSIKLAHSQGFTEEFCSLTSYYPVSSPNVKLVMGGKPYFTSYSVLASQNDILTKGSIKAIAMIPFGVEGRIEGCLNIGSSIMEDVPDWSRLALQTIASEIGLAISRGKLKEEYRKQRVNLDTLFSSITDFIFVVGSDGNILSYNGAITDILGYDKAELIGQSALLAHPPEHRTEAAAIIQEMVEGRRSLCPLPLMKKDGGIIMVETRVVKGTWDGKDCIFGISRDITERTMTEDAVKMANHKLNLLSSITRHDILNQLIILQGYLDKSAGESDREKLQTDLGKMGKAASNIMSSIDLAKEYDSLGSERPAWQSVRETFLHAANGIDLQRIELDVDVDGREIFADPMLRKVFHNLVHNSIVHGGGVSSISLTAISKGERLELVYQDDGQGISDKDREGLFEKGRGRHTGFGLFLSREILALTGIAIEERGEGRGARFVLTVPAIAHRIKM